MNITVYLGAYEGYDKSLKEAVRKLGTWIGESGNGLVYGGSKTGLMGELAESAVSAGGRVIGVEPVFFIDQGLQYERLTQLIVTQDMSERKARMLELGDVFIALPGGTGTLEEISEIMSKTSLGHLDAPCIIYDHNGFYDGLKQLLDKMIEQGLSTKERQKYIYFAQSIDDVIRIADTELFDVVDENGEPTGEIVDRETAHLEGIRHRTSHLWLLRKKDGKTQILLQKRAEAKSFPGCYDISSAGHIPAGDEYIGSAIRELEEELGIKADESDLVCCGDKYITWDDVFFGKPYHDRQYTRIFLLWTDLDEDGFTLQEEEVAGVLWMDFEECVEGVRENSFRNCIDLDELLMVQRTANI